ncbi:ACT domain-containing protein [Aliiglaciecola sp. 3_MG-2023]|uniref:glycine cleavage system protein R n=1 Tax=Aliiglaciecola sp. 3_MG-2023 TaxID=3062644 RepID=UPI0026E29E40|nr:ACT domain-containing protein [Aliiglaciecola sp. 3_MG-2023]MDO6692759.1 ACT domain-containing protein [Aliiglaciecola sp. 3_MG-2023]
MKPIILTLIGKDKPGLVVSLAQKVYSLGGNWLASNFSYMAGHFAGFVEVDIPVENHDTLIDFLQKHPDLTIHSVSADNETDDKPDIVEIDIMGNDKPGIVQELTSTLNRFNINIIKFESSCQSAPNWGSLLFKAHAVVAIPSGFQLDELSEALEDIANDLIVDVDLR